MLEERLNSELNACLLRCVLSAYQENDVDTLKELGLGLSVELLERAKGMSAEVFTRLCRFHVADIRIDERRLSLMLDYVERERDMNAMIASLIKLGASQAMMRELTGIDPREYRDRRKLLGLPAANQGRPPALDDEQTARLYGALRRCLHTNDDLARYQFLGEETGLPLAQIWAHMKLHGE